MSRPQDNPKEHKRMSSDYNENQETEQSESETMSTDETESDELVVAMKSETVYWVGNETEATLYQVDLNETVDGTDGIETCTCPDYRYRVSPDENRACKHIMAVVRAKPSEITVDRMAYDGLTRQYDMLDDKLNTVMQRLTAVQSEAAVSSQTQDVPASDAAGSGEQMAEITAHDAADKLQDKFNEIVTGFDVQAHEGLVWVNKTPDAPEQLPGPGNVETFYTFLADPPQVVYDGDGNKNPPGQYFKNYIEPGDVDQYISEVLE